MTGYIGTPDFVHGTPARVGVLLVNLGTPDEPTTPAVRRYLAEFLWDPRVIEMSRPLWWLVLHGIILRVRPAKSAHAYQKVWTPAGSPLLLESRALSSAVGSRLQQKLGDSLRRALFEQGQPIVPLRSGAVLARRGVDHPGRYRQRVRRLDSTAVGGSR